MAFYTTSSNAGAILTPAQIHELIVEPLQNTAVALDNRVSETVRISTNGYRVPLLTSDVTAQYVQEGAEITPADPGINELDVTTKAIKALTVVSQEMADDSSPAAARLIGDSLVRSTAKVLDQSFFASSTTNGPAGLGSLTPSTVDAGADWTNLDWAAEAISVAQQHGSKPTSFVTSPTTALALRELKDESGSNRPLLGTDPTKPGQDVIFGVPLIVSAAAPDDVVWCLDASRVIVALRDDTTVETSTDAYFSSHRVGIRSVCRVAFAFPYGLGLVKVSLSS